MQNTQKKSQKTESRKHITQLKKNGLRIETETY